MSSIPFFTPVLPGYTKTDEHGFVIENVAPQPCPELLTAEEAVRYLRLDEAGTKDPERSLKHLRQAWGLRGTQVGRWLRYRRVELERLLDKLTRPESFKAAC